MKIYEENEGSFKRKCRTLLVLSQEKLIIKLCKSQCYLVDLFTFGSLEVAVFIISNIYKHSFYSFYTALCIAAVSEIISSGSSNSQHSFEGSLNFIFKSLKKSILYKLWENFHSWIKCFFNCVIYGVYNSTKHVISWFVCNRFHFDFTNGWKIPKISEYCLKSGFCVQVLIVPVLQNLLFTCFNHKIVDFAYF